WHVELADGHEIPGGPNPEWATESRNPEDELISRLDMIMGVLVGENAETPLPEV
ncbi:MAG: hypothetical protein GWN07_37165, partial [Actinobacteria bacterium]|nr:hypothetical protein [Actinomycetota bacterium]